MFILMLFNEKRKWTMQELAERLDIDIESVRKNI
jgi:DNA-binding MarR family transcriptional regulator